MRTHNNFCTKLPRTLPVQETPGSCDPHRRSRVSFASHSYLTQIERANCMSVRWLFVNTMRPWISDEPISCVCRAKNGGSRLRNEFSRSSNGARGKHTQSFDVGTSSETLAPVTNRIGAIDACRGRRQ